MTLCDVATSYQPKNNTEPTLKCLSGVTSDPDLKSSIHSTHNNSKTLELFNKSSVVHFTIDELLTELGNESEIRNGSILLFPPIDKHESVRLISPEEIRLPSSFNDRASHINKTEKPNNNVPATCNNSSSETTAEQKINAPHKSSGNNVNFSNPLMPVNVHNFDAHLWPKNTILIAGTFD